MRLSDLPWLAEQLGERLAAATLPPLSPAAAAPHNLGPWPGGICSAVDGEHSDTIADVEPPELVSRAYRQAHAPHSRNGAAARTTAAGSTSTVTAPSAALAHDDPVLLEKLERLDDLVFDTINGKQPALDELTRLWPQLAAELPRDLLDESRGQICATHWRSGNRA